MISPIPITTSISSNENPRFLVDVIDSFGEEEQLVERVLISVSDANTVEDRICRACQQSGIASCIASLIIVGRGWSVVKARGANSGVLAFRCQEWLLMSAIDNRRVNRRKAARDRQTRDGGNL